MQTLVGTALFIVQYNFLIPGQRYFQFGFLSDTLFAIGFSQSCQSLTFARYVMFPVVSLIDVTIF